MKMTPGKAFEEWWKRKGHLFPEDLKYGFWLAFNDGWHIALVEEYKENTISDDD